VTDLEQVAKRLFWWKSPAEALSDPIRFLAQVMTYGMVEDILAAKRHFSDDAFREVLAKPPSGVFDPRSWSYWHLVFGISPAPPLPTRQIPDS
jgi:hypothetical protein